MKYAVLLLYENLTKNHSNTTRGQDRILTTKLNYSALAATGENGLLFPVPMS